MNIQEMRKQINAEAANTIAEAKAVQKRKLKALSVLAGTGAPKSVSALIREAIPTITGAYTARTVADKIKADTGLAVPIGQVSTTLSKMYDKGEVYRAQKGIQGKTPHVYQRPVEAELM